MYIDIQHTTTYILYMFCRYTIEQYHVFQKVTLTLNRLCNNLLQVHVVHFHSGPLQEISCITLVHVHVHMYVRHLLGCHFVIITPGISTVSKLMIPYNVEHYLDHRSVCRYTHVHGSTCTYNVYYTHVPLHVHVHVSLTYMYMYNVQRIVHTLLPCVQVTISCNVARTRVVWELCILYTRSARVATELGH